MSSLKSLPEPYRYVRATATSASGGMPVLSPIPSMVVCIWSTPASHADRAFATASPMSLWTWTSSGTLISLLTYFTNSYIPAGCIIPTVSGRLILSTFASSICLHSDMRNSGSALLPSSTVNLMLSPCFFAYSTVSTARRAASWRVMRSLSRRWTSDIPRYAAHHFASHPIDTSMSSLMALPCDTMSACSPCFMMVLVASLWSSDITGDISIWSTPK